MYSFILSLTLAPLVGGWSTPCPWRFTPGKYTRYPLHRRLGGPQAWSARVQKILAPPGFDPRTVEPVARPTTIYRPTVICVVLGGDRSVELSWRRTPLWAHYQTSPMVMAVPLFHLFWSPSDDRIGLSVVFIITAKPVLNGT